jgi:photosystem II stability/assembly factor-like uncharacterized protein
MLVTAGNAQTARAQEEQPEVLNPRWVVWPVTPDPGYRTMFAVKMQSSTNAWAVGAGGVALRWNGSAWSKITTPVNVTLRAVDTFGNLAYTVGDGGKIVRWNGVQWQIMDSNSPADLKTISMVSDTLGWTVGTWPPMVRFFVWNGSFWALQESPQDHFIYAMKMLDIDTGWCVGEGGVILKKITGDFVNFESPTSQNLYAVSLLNGDSGFAVGAGGTIIKLNYTWSVQTSPTTATLYGIAAVNASDVWAVGADGTMLHYDGTTWKKVRVNTNKTLYNVSFISTTIGWAVGADGVLLRYLNLPYQGYIPAVYRQTN